MIDLVRSGIEVHGPQKNPTPEVARLAFHLERVATELAQVRERLAKTEGALEASSRTEEYLQKYVDRFEEKAEKSTVGLREKLEELNEKLHKANMRIGELKGALEVAYADNKRLQNKMEEQAPAQPQPRSWLRRIRHHHAEA